MQSPGSYRLRLRCNLRGSISSKIHLSRAGCQTSQSLIENTKFKMIPVAKCGIYRMSYQITGWQRRRWRQKPELSKQNRKSIWRRQGEQPSVVAPCTTLHFIRPVREPIPSQSLTIGFAASSAVNQAALSAPTMLLAYYWLNQSRSEVEWQAPNGSTEAHWQAVLLRLDNRPNHL